MYESRVIVSKSEVGVTLGWNQGASKGTKEGVGDCLGACFMFKVKLNVLSYLFISNQKGKKSMMKTKREAQLEEAIEKLKSTVNPLLYCSFRGCTSTPTDRIKGVCEEHDPNTKSCQTPPLLCSFCEEIVSINVIRKVFQSK